MKKKKKEGEEEEEEHKSDKQTTTHWRTELFTNSKAIPVVNLVLAWLKVLKENFSW